MNIHAVSGMFFCTLLLCQVSLAQQTAHVEGALLLGEKRNIHAGAGRVSGCSSERRCWEEKQWLVRSVRVFVPLSGMCSLVVATRWQDVFLFGFINNVFGDVQLSKDVTVNLCSHGGRSHRYYCLSGAHPQGFPATCALARLHMGKGAIGSCLKALQSGAGGRSDPPEAAGLSEVHAGKPLFIWDAPDCSL